MNNIVKVIATAVCEDKNGREYKRVTIAASPGSDQYVNPATGEVHQVLAPTKTVRAIGYKVPYLYDANSTSAVPDYLWNAEPSMVIEGKIVRKEVIPYEIDENTRNYATVFVQGETSDQDSFAIATKQAFERSGRTLVENAAIVPTEPETVATALGLMVD
jgi:hypothetical protein